MAGLTAEGLVIKRYAEILEEKKQRAIARFLDLVPPGDTVDVSDGTTLGRLIALSVPGEADLWEAIQEVYSAFDPNAAEGVALDNLVALGGITRRDAEKSIAPALFTGDVETTITSGSTVRSPSNLVLWGVVGDVELSPARANAVGVGVTDVQDGVEYKVTFNIGTSSVDIIYTSGVDSTQMSILEGLRDKVLNDFPELTSSIANNRVVIGHADPFRSSDWSTSTNLAVLKSRNRGILQSIEYGRNLQDANTITVIQTPILGWDSVTNPAAATPGRLEETDEELRSRFRDSKFVRASNIIESLYTSLISLDGVDEVRVYENDTDTVSGSGIPPHSFMTIVTGGLDTEIAQAIWQNKPLGIGTAGNTEVPILDSQSFPHVISFERPSPVRIYIDINVSPMPDFPIGGAEMIKDALVEYIRNLGVGEDVIYSRLYTPINSVIGHQINSLLIGTTSPPSSTSNISIEFNQLASLSRSDIVVTI